MATQKQQERLFMTGASGYIGSVITELATAEGYDVHALSRTETSDTKLRSLGAVPVRGDLTSLDVLRRESADADVVIHLATAYTIGVGTYEAVMPVDIAAVDAIADALAGTGKPLVVTSGTLSVAADPMGAETTEASPPESNPISTRIKTEQHALALARRGIRVMGVRLAPYVYGRGGSGVKLFMGMSAQAGSVTCVDGGKNHTTVVHVDDAARLFLLAAQKGKAGELFNASGATDVTARQIFDAIAAALGVPVRDITYADALAKVGETFAWFLKAENRASGAKAVKELGWQPNGTGILDEINKGSYQAVAEALRKASD
jgi:nucleoside-diphosphate-sugar epimerase